MAGTLTNMTTAGPTTMTSPATTNVMTPDMAVTPINININITFNGNDSTIMTSTATTLSSSASSSGEAATTEVMSTAMGGGGATTTLAALSTTTAANSWLGLSMSNTLLITVFTGCTALILLVLCVICCRLLCVRNKRETTEGDRVKRQSSRPHNTNHYADPRVMENHYHSNDVTKFYATPEVTYARPEIYSTFINPSFYEDVYARWKMQEQSRFETNYDSPNQYSRRLRDQMETPGFKWSAGSLRVLDDYDYETYGRIPRGKLASADTDREDTEIVATETPEFTTF